MRAYIIDSFCLPYGAHFAQVAVNVRTGEIKVQTFYALQDAGTPINPELALHQMYGAAPAIAIAIHDAVGIWMCSWPFSAEKILREFGKI